MGQAYRLARGGRIDRSKADRHALQRRGAWGRAPATRWPRRCLPTASISSGARSSIIDRAASSAMAPRSRTRCCRSTAATAAAIRTIAPPASRRCTAWRCARRTTGRRCASTSAPSTMRCRRCSSPASTTRRSCGRAPSGIAVYEPAIRAAAGLGRAPAVPDPDRYQHAHAHCDVLVVGAGPAGIAAALAACESGKRVMLVDEQAEMGGDAAARADRHHRRPVGLGLARGGAGAAEPARQRHAAAAHHRLRLLQSQPPGPGAAADRPLGQAAPGRGRASGCGRCAPARWCWRRARTSGRWCSPATTGPASCWPRACARSSIATAWCRDSARRSSPPARPPTRRRRT